MSNARALPVIMPEVAGQRWSCHSCGDCCRTLVGHLFDDERQRIEQQGWAEELGVAPYVRLGKGWALNKRPDGTCVFLDEQNRCRIHGKLGENAKPLACRIFPFSMRKTAVGWRTSLRFDCPSVTSSKGVPLSAHRPLLTELSRKLEATLPTDTEAVRVRRGLWADEAEIHGVVASMMRWITSDDLSAEQRLLGAARVTITLAEAKLAKVRGDRLVELLDLLLSEAGTMTSSATSPTRKQRGMLRQVAFAHAEHVSLADLTGGTNRRGGHGRKWTKRWQQLRMAKRFLAGRGEVPPLPGITGSATFEQVEQVAAPDGRVRAMDDLLTRYLAARLSAHSVFGSGYYGWSIIHGLTALWLSVAAASWLARLRAAAAGRQVLTLDDLASALGIVDRAATRLPSLGTLAERARVDYLLRDEGVVRLLGAYVPDSQADVPSAHTQVHEVQTEMQDAPAGDESCAKD